MKTASYLLLISMLLLLACQREVAQQTPPVLTTLSVLSFSPDSAFAGDTIFVIGRGFNPTPNGTVVTINNLQQVVTLVSDSILFFKIAPATTSGKIAVAANANQAQSLKTLVIKTLVQQQPLTITSFSPDSVFVGDTVRIKGVGFNTTALQNLVSINSLSQTVLTATDTSLSIKIAIGTTTDKISISNLSQTTLSSTHLFIKVQNPWTQKADLPAIWPDYSAVTGISAANRGFFFRGQLWEYLPVQNSWIKKADKPADGSGAYSFSFTLNNKIYIGYGGYTSLDSVRLWEYDLASDAWTKKKNIPIKPRIAPFAFAANNTGFVGGGQGDFASTNLHLHDFWKYDALNDSWTQMADFPGPWTIGISGFGIGNDGFVYDAGLGFPQAPTAYRAKGQIWQYLITTNAWVEKATCPGGNGSYSASVFVIGAKAYVGITTGSAIPKNDFWMFDPSINSWTKKTDVGGGIRWFGSGFSIGGKGYVGLGTGTTFNQQKKDFWEYTPE